MFLVLRSARRNRSKLEDLAAARLPGSIIPRMMTELDEIVAKDEKDPTSNEIEAANRAEITARLIRLRFRVYRPEADCHGEDLVLRTPDGKLLSVQLKSRPTVDWGKYGNNSIWMLFPDPKGDFTSGRKWFLVPHDELYKWFVAKHGHTSSMQDKQGWSVNGISELLAGFLGKFAV